MKFSCSIAFAILLFAVSPLPSDASSVARYSFRPSASGMLPNEVGTAPDATAQISNDSGWIDSDRGPALQIQEENDLVRLPSESFPGAQGAVQITFRADGDKGKPQHLFRVYHARGDGLTLYFSGGDLLFRYLHRESGAALVARLPAAAVPSGEWITATANWDLNDQEWTISVQVDEKKKVGAKLHATGSPNFSSESAVIVGNEHAGKGQFQGALLKVEIFDEPQVVVEDPQAKATPVEAIRLPWVERKRVLPETLFFSRTQPKYNLHINTLLRRWTDRPLFFDRSTGESEKPYAIIAPKSFLKVQESMLKYGLDGTGALVGSLWFQSTGFEEMMAALEDAKPQKYVPLILEVSGVSTEEQLEKKLKLFTPLVEKALRSPYLLRINGKLPVLSYHIDIGDVSLWKRFTERLRTQFGDQLLFIADVTTQRPALLSEFNTNGGVSSATIERFKSHLREWLMVSDGIMWASGSHTNWPNGTFNREFYREFLVPVFHTVLNEEPFRRKLLGLDAEVGYINVMTSRSTNWEENTARLRDTLEIALLAKPDFVTMPEWDELNENTSIGPTLTNGLTTARIINYYRSRFKGETNAPLAGDDIHIPNLIISTMPYVRLGAPIRIELLHLPEGKQPFTATLSLLDESGKVIKTFPPHSFTSESLEVQELTLPSEALAVYRWVTPSLHLQLANGREMNWSTGLESIRLQPSWNLNYKSTKIALRDLLLPEHTTFQLESRVGDSQIVVKGSALSDEPLGTVEVVQDWRELFAVDAHRELEPGENEALVMLHWQGMQGMRNFNGTISIRNGKLRKFVDWKRPDYKMASYLLEASTNAASEQTITFNTDEGVNPTNARGGFFIISNPQDAVIVMETNQFKLELPVSDLLAHRHVARTYNFGLTVEAHHLGLSPQVPLPLNQKEVAFETKVTPWRSDTPLQMRIVSPSGKIFRSQPHLMTLPNDAPVTLPIWSETLQQPVSIQVAGNRVPTLSAEMKPERGAILHTTGGAYFHGLIGGVPFDMAAFSKSDLATAYPAATAITQPEWTLNDGRQSLKFDGRGNFIYFPEETIPRGAFALEMTLKSTSSENQILCTTRGYRRGAFTLLYVGGELVVEWIGTSGKLATLQTGLSLPKDEWAHVTLSYNLESLNVSVNGESTNLALPERGTQVIVPFIFGGYGTGKGHRYFSGYLSGLTIHHRPL